MWEHQSGETNYSDAHQQRLAQWFPATVHRGCSSTLQQLPDLISTLNRRGRVINEMSCCTLLKCIHAPQWVVADNTSLTCFCKSFRGLTAYQMMEWICVRAKWHWSDSGNVRIFTSNGSSNLDLEKQGGQLGSSTSIRHVSMKKNNEDRWTHWHPNCHTGKLCSGTEVHLLLNNQETQITVRQIKFTVFIIDCLSLNVTSQVWTCCWAVC